MKLIDILSEATFETYFMQVIIKIDKDKSNNTEVYNQIRGIKDIIVIKIVSNPKLEAMSDDRYDYELLEVKFINEGTPKINYLLEYTKLWQQLFHNLKRTNYIHRFFTYWECPFVVLNLPKNKWILF